MKPNIFMSYSRRELGFVDDLTNQLEKAGFKVWLDYRALIPGSPWAAQIDKGLNEAEAIVLVVSKSSIASQFVELEWRKVLNENKRIILVIFEAVDLPPELEKFEWVDFRGSYKKGLKELISQLQTPIKEKHLAPETGFKAPFVVWLTAALSALAGFYSLFAFWTVLVPVSLFPLAWRVYKRDYNFQNVQTALWFMPFSLFVTYGIGLFIVNPEVDTVNPNSINNLILNLIFFFFLIGVFTSVTLVALLRSRAMQRWGKPEATPQKFANMRHPKNPKPDPVSFFIDHAPQDRKVAAELSKKLKSYGHPVAPDYPSAKAVFVLISRFKSDTEADPEQQAVFPVLVQTAAVSEKLSHVQWIDFRKGMHNLDAVAQLLPNPANMLAALGVRPVDGKQIVTPKIINAAVNFLTAIVLFNISGLAMNFLSQFSADTFLMLADQGAQFTGILFQQALAGALATVLALFTTRDLRRRSGMFASIPAFLGAYSALFLILSWQMYQTALLDDLIVGNSPDSFVSSSLNVLLTALPFMFFIAGSFFIGFRALFRIRDLTLWFPAGAK